MNSPPPRSACYTQTPVGRGLKEADLRRIAIPAKHGLGKKVTGQRSFGSGSCNFKGRCKIDQCEGTLSFVAIGRSFRELFAKKP